MWSLSIIVMSATFNLTSTTIGNFETRDLCQQAQQAVVQQMLRFSPQPQFQTICMMTRAAAGEEIK